MSHRYCSLTLKAFKAGGSTTAGNSSQVTDGAAMVLLARQGAKWCQSTESAWRFSALEQFVFQEALHGKEVGPAHCGPLPLFCLRWDPWAIGFSFFKEFIISWVLDSVSRCVCTLLGTMLLLWSLPLAILQIFLLIWDCVSPFASLLLSCCCVP